LLAKRGGADDKHQGGKVSLPACLKRERKKEEGKGTKRIGLRTREKKDENFTKGKGITDPAVLPEEGKKRGKGNHVISKEKGAAWAPDQKKKNVGVDLRGGKKKRGEGRTPGPGRSRRRGRGGFGSKRFYSLAKEKKRGSNTVPYREKKVGQKKERTRSSFR